MDGIWRAEDQSFAVQFRAQGGLEMLPLSTKELQDFTWWTQGCAMPTAFPPGVSLFLHFEFKLLSVATTLS